MTLEEYNEKRAGLYDEAEQLIDAGSLDEANAKMDEMTNLDDEWKQSCETRANLEALKDNMPKINVQNLTDNTAEAAVAGSTAKATDVANFMKGADSMKMDKEDAYASDVYMNAWAKAMMNKRLTDNENSIMRLVNEDYEHTTENTPVVIPKTVAANIWHEIDELYPYWADITKTTVKGKLTVIKGLSSSDAKWYDEETETEDGKEEFGELNLDGCELARAIPVSWKLREMAIPDFITYIQNRLAQKMGAALGYGVVNGKGVVDGEKPEPKGVITALKEEEETPQVTTYTKGELSYKDLTKARSKILSGYNPSIYANNTTIWDDLANVVDENGRPIFIADPSNGGVYRVLGCIVKEDASVADGDVLFSDGSAYHANVNRDITVQTEEHVKNRYTDYCAYAIVDGAPLSNKAHSLLTAGE